MWNTSHEHPDPVLVAEPEPGNARQLMDCLLMLDIPGKLVTSGEQLLEVIREHIFNRAVVSASLEVQGQPAVACLARLPSMRCLIAMGDNGDDGALARSWGATVYIQRPNSMGALAELIHRQLLNVACRERLR